MINAGSPKTSKSSRRAAVYWGLKGFLSDEQLLRTMWIWEERYSTGPKYAIHEFLCRITDTEGLKKSRSRMQISIMKALMSDGEAMGPDPLPAMRDYLERKNGIPRPEPIGQAMALVEQTRQLMEELLGPTAVERLDQLAADYPPNDDPIAFLDHCKALVATLFDVEMAEKKFRPLYASVRSE